MNTNNTFESRIVCEGTEVSENQHKILFQQKLNQCWVPKKDIRFKETLGNLYGEKVIRIVVPEDVANTLELQGIMD
jgi:hypothetical protein